MSKCIVIFRDEELKQDTIVHCETNKDGVVMARMSFDPSANEKTDLGALAGELAYAFVNMLEYEQKD
jgi:hypothetical protein